MRVGRRGSKVSSKVWVSKDGKSAPQQTQTSALPGFPRSPRGRCLALVLVHPRRDTTRSAIDALDVTRTTSRSRLRQDVALGLRTIEKAARDLVQGREMTTATDNISSHQHRERERDRDRSASPSRSDRCVAPQLLILRCVSQLTICA